MKSSHLIGLASLALLLGGCAFQGTQNTSYYQYTPRAYDGKIAGKAAIEMSAAEQDAKFTGKPTSFTGGGSTLTLPLGEITREAARLAFSDLFAQGTTIVDKTPASGYVAVIKPKISQFTYEYNQLKNAGFAITPTTVVTLSVSVADGNGKAIWSKNFDTGNFEGSTYMVSGSPGEEISKTAHRAVMKAMQEAADAIQKDPAIRAYGQGAGEQPL